MDTYHAIGDIPSLAGSAWELPVAFHFSSSTNYASLRVLSSNCLVDCIWVEGVRILH